MEKTLCEKQNAWAIAWQDRRCARSYALLEKSLMGYIVEAAQACAWSSVDLEELKQAGRLGIVVALTRFDRSHPGATIAGVACKWIKSEVFALAQQGASSASSAKSGKERKIQRHALKKIDGYMALGMSKAEAILFGAEDFGVDSRHLEKMVAARAAHDFALSEPDGVMLACDKESPEEAAARSHAADVLDACMDYAGLSSKERNILVERWMTDDDKPTSMDAIAARYGVSRERIRQTLRHSEGRVRDYLKYQGLGFSDFV